MQHDRSGVGAAQVLGVQVLPRIRALRLPVALGLASLLAATGPSRAQDAPLARDAAPPSLREMVRQRQGELEDASVKELARSLPPSLATVLGLDARQVERLDRLHGDFVLARLEQEGKIARWQDDLKRAQSATSFDEGKSRGLLKSIAEAQDNIRAAFLKARGQSLQALTPAQRAQVQALAQAAPAPESPTTPPASTLDEPNAPSPVREDAYRKLLLMPVERLLHTPLDTQAARRVLAERAAGRYDRYGLSRYGYSSGRYGGAFGGFGFGWGRGHGFGGIYGAFGHRDTYGGHPQHGGAHH